MDRVVQVSRCSTTFFYLMEQTLRLRGPLNEPFYIYVGTLAKIAHNRQQGLYYK